MFINGIKENNIILDKWLPNNDIDMNEYDFDFNSSTGVFTYGYEIRKGLNKTMKLRP